ncbi:hypothetical protein, partial [Nocardia sp. NPDC019302]|uniref:hypothetical protein n=1 Tax=Nocardia sp. NPDC019302 TaxID=3154592 RepID=UPI0033DFE068
GLDEAFTDLRDPLAALAELAELAAARGFLDDADGPRMRFPDDFEPLTSDERYGDEQFWLSEADDDGLREVRADLRRAGLSVEEPRPHQLPAAPASPVSLPPAPTDLKHATAHRGTAAREFADAQADLAEARRGLPVNDEDLTPGALDDALADLRSRSMRLDEQGAWQDRLTQLERAARRVFDAQDELAHAEEVVRQADRAAGHRLDADAERLTAQRDAAARELADARADLAEARRDLPVDDDDLTQGALDDALERLRSRTMRVEEQQPWQDRLTGLEHAARRVFDAEDEVARWDDALAQATRVLGESSNEIVRESDPRAAEHSARAERDAELARLSAQRDAAERELADARADLVQARRGLPVNDEDLTRDALDDALEGLRGRSMRVDEQGPWQERVAGLERAARRVFDAEDGLGRAEAAVREGDRERSAHRSPQAGESGSRAARGGGEANGDASRPARGGGEDSSNSGARAHRDGDEESSGGARSNRDGDSEPPEGPSAPDRARSRRMPPNWALRSHIPHPPRDYEFEMP